MDGRTRDPCRSVVVAMGVSILQQQIMRACGENPAAFKRKPEAESEHQRQQADAEARAQRWAEQKDADAMRELPSREVAKNVSTDLFLL